MVLSIAPIIAALVLAGRQDVCVPGQPKAPGCIPTFQLFTCGNTTATTQNQRFAIIDGSNGSFISLRLESTSADDDEGSDASWDSTDHVGPGTRDYFLDIDDVVDHAAAAGDFEY